jgi:hypothetical protein
VPAARGIDFVGWRTWWSHRVPRRRSLGRLASRVDQAERRMLRPAFSGLAVRVALPQRAAPIGAVRSAPVRRRWDLPALQQTLASYSGHLRHGGSWRAWQGVLARHAWLGFAFALDGWQVRPRWKPDAVEATEGFGAAYRGCVRCAGEQCLVFWRVGRFIEFYGPQRLLAERVLGLRRTWLPRGGYAFTAGFPRRLAPHYATRALRAGVAVALVRAPVAAGFWPTGPTALLVPGAAESGRSYPEGSPVLPSLREDATSPVHEIGQDLSRAMAERRWRRISGVRGSWPCRHAGRGRFPERQASTLEIERSLDLRARSGLNIPAGGAWRCSDRGAAASASPRGS